MAEIDFQPYISAYLHFLKMLVIIFYYF